MRTLRRPDTYYRGFRGDAEPDKGFGADWEGAHIASEIYKDKSRTVKFVPVFFRQQEVKFIPEPLRGQTFYVLDSERAYTKLYAFITGQAGVTAADLGPLQTLAMEKVEPLTFGDAESIGGPQLNPLASNVRLNELWQQAFLKVAERIPELVNVSYLQKCQMQISDGLIAAECGATFAHEFGDGSKDKTLGIISNGLKKFRMTLPAQVKQTVLSLSGLSEGAEPELLRLYRESIRGQMHPTLCGWILLDGLLNKDLNSKVGVLDELEASRGSHKACMGGPSNYRPRKTSRSRRSDRQSGARKTVKDRRVTLDD